ncbi:MAG: hypothetical protein JSR78_09870, partial [Proteobacteria bacterium]|nr:hypothetical protein [Pseudomonadota bacterium]
MSQNFNDSPISSPEQDRFGFDPLAKALAQSIAKVANPEGTVFAVNGPWGSGKSSVLNLIQHHILQAGTDRKIEIVNFACWWFRGEEALTAAFLQELFSALKPALSEKAQTELKKLATRLLRSKDLFGPLMTALGAMTGVDLVKGAADTLEKLLADTEPVDVQQQRLAEQLRKQPLRFLVIIDDLDRLLPDEALQVFRLIKSVGRLPNVMYLLAFDRQIAEKVVAERYPSEGPHYLEKIIQASFELPSPSTNDLNDDILDRIANICGLPSQSEMVHFMNVFYDCVAPFIKSPRDVNRICSTISVTWPAVKGDVNIADFVAMEALRISHGAVYRRIQLAKDLLVGGARDRSSQDERAEIKKRTEALFSDLPEAEREHVKGALQRLFPCTQSIWGGTSYGSDWDGEWQRSRLVCSSAHFNTYFAFSIQDDALPGAVVTELLSSTNDRQRLQTLFRDALNVARRRGGTRAALLLEELNVQAKQIPAEHIDIVIASLYSIADELDVERDKARGFAGLANNELRLHWLTNRLVKERLPLNVRSPLFLKAARSAPLGWLVSFAYRAYAEHVPEKGDAKIAEDDRLCSLVHAKELKRTALRKIKQAARDGTLLTHRHFTYMLFRWHSETKKENGSEAARWLLKAVRDPASAIRVAEAFTQESWSHTASDRIAQKNTTAGTKALSEVIALPVLRKALETAVADASLSRERREVGQKFLEMWDQQTRRGKIGSPEFD